ncbi:MAG: hypothetical protein M1816_000631 [Peltula sp. TS41687]|nr:MAG: hypothetical protein M1816_000631 [Peltula sp. TS41687]
MPRSAIDATRFTPTGPYATSKSYPSPTSTSSTTSPLPKSTSQRPPPSSARPHETPHEKVARIRAAAQKAKLDKISTFDKVVLVGRVWADRAHRFVALGLIFSSVLCGLYATVALTDMVMYNRRKRKEWYATESMLYAKFLAEATAAESQGSATEEQVEFLKKERMIQRAEEEERNKPGVWKRTKEWLLKDLKRDDGGAVVASEVMVMADDDNATPAPAEATGTGTGTAGGGVLKAVEALRKDVAEGDKREHDRPHVAGGVLDQLAAAEKKAVGSTTGGSGSSSWWKGWGRDGGDAR